MNQLPVNASGLKAARFVESSAAAVRTYKPALLEMREAFQESWKHMGPGNHPITPHLDVIINYFDQVLKSVAPEVSGGAQR